MSVNILGHRKTWQITAAIKLPVLRATVWSHHQSGRWAYLTVGRTGDHLHHRHFWYDRHTGDLMPAQLGPHTDYCREKFPGETGLYDQALAAQAELAHILYVTQ